MEGKCPHCDATIDRLQVKGIESEDQLGTVWKTAIFVCPKCAKVVSAGFDTAHYSNELFDKVRNLVEQILG
jgi:transcription initiation factor IIE alpha subunit